MKDDKMKDDQMEAAKAAINKMLLSCGPLTIDTILRQGMLTIWQSLKEENQNKEFFVDLVQRKYIQILDDFKKDYDTFMKE